jgi:hypothetical protein
VYLLPQTFDHYYYFTAGLCRLPGQLTSPTILFFTGRYNGRELKCAAAASDTRRIHLLIPAVSLPKGRQMAYLFLSLGSYFSFFKLNPMAENKNLGSQNQGQGRSGQQSGNLGSSKGRGDQSSNRDLGLDEDLQQDVSTGGSQQSGRSGRQGSQEDLDLGTERSDSDRGNRSGSQSGSGRDSNSGSSLGNR